MRDWIMIALAYLTGILTLPLIASVLWRIANRFSEEIEDAIRPRP